MGTSFRLIRHRSGRDDTALLDFDDLLLHTAAAIENDGAVAEEFRDRYRCFVVDEYQDVTPLQQRVLDAWLGETETARLTAFEALGQRLEAARRQHEEAKALDEKLFGEDFEAA